MELSSSGLCRDEPAVMPAGTGCGYADVCVFMTAAQRLLQVAMSNALGPSVAEDEKQFSGFNPACLFRDCSARGGRDDSFRSEFFTTRRISEP
jgi:hypothetical protein